MKNARFTITRIAGVVVAVAGSTLATAQAVVPAAIQTGVDNAVDMATVIFWSVLAIAIAVMLFGAVKKAMGR